MTTGLLIGRYQPFHKGHLEVVKKLLEECDHLIIGIGSAQYSHAQENPFSGKERARMVEAALEEADIDPSRYEIVEVPDVHNDELWAKEVKEKLNFDVAYTRNPQCSIPFKKAGVEVKEQPMFDRHKYSGTGIRERMAEGGEWESLVPPGVVRVINEINGVERLKPK